MMLSIMVGNGSQLIAMVGTTLGEFWAIFLSEDLTNGWMYSLCSSRIPLTI